MHTETHTIKGRNLHAHNTFRSQEDMQSHYQHYHNGEQQNGAETYQPVSITIDEF